MFTLYIHAVICSVHCQPSRDYDSLADCLYALNHSFFLDAHVIGPEGEAYLLVETPDPVDSDYVDFSFERV
jgi:hypothetical protein